MNAGAQDRLMAWIWGWKDAGCRNFTESERTQVIEIKRLEKLADAIASRRQFSLQAGKPCSTLKPYNALFLNKKRKWHGDCLINHELFS